MSGVCRPNFIIFQKLCGVSVKDVVIVTTTLGDLDPGRYRQRAGGRLKTRAYSIKPALDNDTNSRASRQHCTLCSSDCAFCHLRRMTAGSDPNRDAE
jgi:hypothetical protein